MANPELADAAKGIKANVLSGNAGNAGNTSKEHNGIIQSDEDIPLTQKFYEHEAINMATMAKERQKASFNVRHLTHLLEGGPEGTQLMEHVYQELERDPIFHCDRFDLDVDAQRKLAMARLRRMCEFKAVADEKTHRRRMEALEILDSTLVVRYLVHISLYQNAIIQNGTPDQIKRWMPDAEAFRTTGCFAMTELGHGSYLQGLETTATFNKDQDCFIINSPTETSTKWWIGGAASTAVACICYAQLIVDNVRHGVHCFHVPLRNKKTFHPLIGISIGDCGMKMGRNGLDNGWIQFSHVKIPREDMLMRFTKVSRNGTVTKSADVQMAYGPLVLARILVIHSAIETLKKALTIAVRYGAVRRQFSMQKTLEKQILDYASHKRRLMPILAEVYALQFAGAVLQKSADEMSAKLAQNDTSLLADLHPLAAGIKAFSSWFTLASIEECRQCCGGLGYSAYSGLPMVLTEFAVMCTWEGDNTVMAQQTARYLTKSLQSAATSGGRPLIGSVVYLKDYAMTLKGKFPNVTNIEDLMNVENQDLAFKYVATRAITDAALKLKQCVKNGDSLDKAWDNATVELVQCAKAHCYYYMMQSFHKILASIKEDANNSNNRALHDVLSKLCHLFVWHSLYTFFLPFLVEDGFMAYQTTLKVVQLLISQLCDDIREQAVPLVDAFGLTDFMLQSPLGRYDGNVYRGYYDRVQKYPGVQETPAYFEELIKPLFDQSEN